MPWASSRSSLMVSWTATTEFVEHLGGRNRIFTQHVFGQSQD